MEGLRREQECHPRFLRHRVGSITLPTSQRKLDFGRAADASRPHSGQGVTNSAGAHDGRVDSPDASCSSQPGNRRRRVTSIPAEDPLGEASPWSVRGRRSLSRCRTVEQLQLPVGPDSIIEEDIVSSTLPPAACDVIESNSGKPARVNLSARGAGARIVSMEPSSLTGRRETGWRGPAWLTKWSDSAPSRQWQVLLVGSMGRGKDVRRSNRERGWRFQGALEHGIAILFGHGAAMFTGSGVRRGQVGPVRPPACPAIWIESTQSNVCTDFCSTALP